APPGSGLVRRKYPFVAGEYFNAFFSAFVAGVDLTPLKFNIIAEAIDTRGTATKDDDRIARKAYLVQVRIPDIVIDTVALPSGQAGVDYNEFLNAGGGVPPLQFDLEHTDGDPSDGIATAADPLTQDLFGIDIDENTGQFFGVPRASSNVSGAIDLTLRVFAAVMNPTQGGTAYVPTGTAGEFDGRHPITGLSGRHKTFPVFFDAPTAPMVATASLAPGTDGQAYPGDRVAGAGGVPRLVPNPVGFGGAYPSATAARNYEWSSTYVLDASHPDPSLGLGNAGDTVAGLPHALTVDTVATSATNGEITGITYDRGFHPVTFNGLDFYAGDGSGPSATVFQQPFFRKVALSVAPDSAIYLRGVQAGEATGGAASGLLDATAQMAEPRMVPLFLAGGLFSIDGGAPPVLLNTAMPKQIDLLPVLLANGGSDAHNRKSIPSISGFWPAESNKEVRWYYFGTQAWKHAQQETTWIQAPNPDHTRVFLWSETTIKTFSNGTWTQKYQLLSTTGKRGILIVNPLTGEFHVPAILTNNDPAHGSQFGAEVALGGRSTSSTGQPASGYDQAGYWKYYYYAVRDTRHDREVRSQGLSTYIDSYGTARNTGNAWYKNSQGRAGVSVAMSAQGIWCATALPGGSEQKLLLWRTDKQPIPAAILAQPYVTGLNGLDADGSTLLDSACIISVGGEVASGNPISTNQEHLFPDSVTFVQDGLLFLNRTNLDEVFGVSLVDGHLSSKSLNGVSRTAINAAGTGPTVVSTDGQFPPDTDYLRGNNASSSASAQFAFKGNKPAPGSTGPDKVVFVAGDNRALLALSDLSAVPRDGYMVHPNANKALMFLDLTTGATGLDLAASTLKDLTGGDSDIYGDLLTGGRFGEELDFVALSDDGAYAAVVRDINTQDRSISTFGYSPTYATGASSGTSWVANDDVLIISTIGDDMDTSATGDQHVLFVGSKSYTAGTTTNPSGMPSYATGRPYFNARYRRINGVTFASDGRTLILNYSGNDSRPTKYSGSTSSYVVNPGGTNSSTFNTVGVQISVRIQFRTSSGDAINFGSIGTNMANNLAGLTGVGNVGPTTPRFGATTSSVQLFWATFKSHNGDFLYYISDGLLTARNHMVGFNISDGPLGGHQPYVPFSPHGSTIGFEQFDANSFNYEPRFAAVPGGVTFPTTGRDGAGILCVIASDSSAGALSATDLEVYVMDTNIGSDLVALTSDVTTGSANAINHLYLSADGNVVVGQRTATSANSRENRGNLNGNSDLFAVTNIHDVLAGAAPTAFVVSAGQSHGSTTAFVGEGSAVGAQALIFSAATAGGNTTWDDRTLRISVLGAGAVPVVLDATASHYVVLAGGRKLDDIATDGQ
ncbi:MAG: hypothetical protein ACYTFD_18690, partial [Planctomycetota bacterium]